MSDQKQQVEAMIKKASETDKADDAMKFSQAALNAANAMCSLDHISKTAGRSNKSK